MLIDGVESRAEIQEDEKRHFDVSHGAGEVIVFQRLGPTPAEIY